MSKLILIIYFLPIFTELSICISGVLFNNFVGYWEFCLLVFMHLLNLQLAKLLGRSDENNS